MRRPRRDERGSTVIEMAIVASVLFSMLLGMVTFALVQASDNSGTKAAREGARSASLNVFCADAYSTSTTLDSTACPTAPSAAYTAVLTSVTRRLGGLVAGTPTVAVTCLWGSAPASPPPYPLDPKPCNASVVPDVDLVRVTVTWTRLASNPISHASTHTDSATATIQGSGKGSSDTSACLANATVSPSTVALAAGTPPTSLTAGVTVTVYTNGFCATPLTIGFGTGTDLGTSQVSSPMQVMPNGTDFTFSITAAQYRWDAGTYLVTVTDFNGNRITFVAQPQITVTGADCQFVSASVSPSSAIIATGSSPGPLSQPVTLSLTTTSGCQTISAQFNPGASPAQSVNMSGTAPNYTLTISPAIPLPLQWTTGLKAFSFTDVTDGNAPLRNEQSVNLNVTLLCGITVTLNPNPVTHSNGGNLKSDVTVTATPATGADCTGLTVTYSYAGGTSTQPMALQGSGVYQYTISKNANNWSVATYPMTFASYNNPAVVTAPPTQLTVN